MTRLRATSPCSPNAWTDDHILGKSGVADIIACIDGTFWSLEVKRDGKLPTKLQCERMNEVRSAGGQATWGVANKVIAEIELWRSSAARGRAAPSAAGEAGRRPRLVSE